MALHSLNHDFILLEALILVLRLACLLLLDEVPLGDFYKLA